jgi:TolB-like protein
MITMKKTEEILTPIPVTEVHAACELILASNLFTNAPRMRRLLRFLVDKAIIGTAQDTSEYAIGIEVFDRNATVYNTNEDPIVRVQVGRLRRKLKAYYAIHGTDTDIEILISIGGYLPVIRRMGGVNNDFMKIPMFAIHPFKCISHTGDGEPFTQGLHDELVHQLFKVFGKIIVARSFFMPGGADKERRAYKNITRAGVNHRLEGSIQIDSERIRASVRLIDASAGCIAWSEQFNRKASLAISLQEELATSICDALKGFFCYE